MLNCGNLSFGYSTSWWTEIGAELMLAVTKALTLMCCHRWFGAW